MRLKSSLRALATVLAIMAVAAGFWLYQISGHPRGMHVDENIQGVEGLRIVQGGYLPFYPASPSHQYRFRYLAAGAIALLGRTPGALRLMNVMVGLATIPGIYLATRQVFGQRLALLSVLVFATTLWPILAYRVYIAARTLPPFYLAYFAWQAILAWKTGRALHWLAAGAILGAAMYTYYSILLFPMALAGWLAILALRRRLRRLWPGAAYGALAFALVAAPLGLIFLKFGDQSLYRPGEVSVLHAGMSPGEAAGTLWNQTYQTLRMFFFSGDWDPLANAWLPGGPPPPPVFPLAIAIPFAIGHLVLLSRWRSGWTAFYYIWAAVALLPTILSTELPSFGRACMLLAVLFIWPALGLDWLRAQLARRIAPLAGLVLPAGLLGLGALSTGRVIFLEQWYAQPWKAVHFYDMAWTEMAIEINEFLGQGWTGENLIARPRQIPQDRLVIVEAELWRYGLRDSVVEYLVGSDHPAVQIVPVEPAEPEPAQTILLFWRAGSDQDPFTYLPGGRQIAAHTGGWDWDVTGQVRLAPMYVAFLATPPQFDTAGGPAACWRERLCLWAAAARAEKGWLEVELVWQSPPTNDLTPEVRLALVREGEVRAQSQLPVAPDGLPLARWRGTDYISRTMRLALPAPLDPEADRLVLALHPSGAAVEPLAPDGASAAEVDLPLPAEPAP